MLVGGKKPQMRKASGKNWTKAREDIFLSVLAQSCNVTRACEAAGVGVTSVYRRKKENAAFRAAWLAAIAVAYQQLELVLLERAFVGTEKVVRIGAGQAQTMREYSNQLGLSLLKMHRETAADADYEMAPNDVEEMRERLIRKLQRVRERDAADHDPQE